MTVWVIFDIDGEIINIVDHRIKALNFLRNGVLENEPSETEKDWIVKDLIKSYDYYIDNEDIKSFGVLPICQKPNTYCYEGEYVIEWEVS